MNWGIRQQCSHRNCHEIGLMASCSFSHFIYSSNSCGLFLFPIFVFFITSLNLSTILPAFYQHFITFLIIITTTLKSSGLFIPSGGGRCMNGIPRRPSPAQPTWQPWWECRPGREGRRAMCNAAPPSTLHRVALDVVCHCKFI